MHSKNKFWTIFLNGTLAILWGHFAYRSIVTFLVTKDPIFLLFTAAQTEFAFLLLLRKESFATSKKVSDYIVAFLGTTFVFLYMPGIQLLQYGTLQHIIGDVFIYIASFSQIFGFFSLNTSAGIVPANRGIKTQGMYRFVRHPIYLGSMFQYVGCFLLHATTYNAVVLLLAACFQIMRLQREEKLLYADSQYQEYAKIVKWRLVPGLY